MTMSKASTFIMVAVALIIGISIGIFSAISKAPVEVGNVSLVTDENKTETIPVENPFGTSISVPAVDNTGRGVTTQIFVDIKDGTGQALVDVNQILFWVDTQFSIRTAKNVAQEYTKVNLSTKDLKYGIKTEAELIEGPSAGAAITVATIAAIKNISLSPNVMITGTIESDGSIGPVGGILEKAKASKEAGATLFIVPSGQSVIVRHIPNTTCQNIGNFRYCSTKFVSQQIRVQEDAGMEVVEAPTIVEAARYFNL
jgi:uncharacterized protein